MGILTKIFIITLVVLILIACPIFIRQATIAPSWSQVAKELQTKADIAQQNASMAALGSQQLSQQYAQLQQDSSREKLDMQAEMNEQAAQLASVRQENARLQNDFQALTVELSRLRADYETNTQRTDVLAQQRQDAFARLETLNEESRRLSDQFQQSQLEAQRQGEIGRMLNEQLTEREERIKQLEQAMAGGAPAAASAVAPSGAPSSATAISGTITEVADDIASVNVGSAKGVKAGMQLVVFRGADFVANLRIQDVRVDQAAGLITDRRLDVRQGDKVTTRL